MLQRRNSFAGALELHLFSFKPLLSYFLFFFFLGGGEGRGAFFNHDDAADV